MKQNQQQKQPKLKSKTENTKIIGTYTKTSKVNKSKMFFAVVGNTSSPHNDCLAFAFFVNQSNNSIIGHPATLTLIP